MSEQPTQRINKGCLHKKRKNLPMKTSNGLTAAFADGPRETIQARFAFEPNEPADAIYSDLVRTARRACELPGARSLKLTRHERACIGEMVDDGVAKLGRADVVAMHNGYFATATAGTRG